MFPPLLEVLPVDHPSVEDSHLAQSHIAFPGHLRPVMGWHRGSKALYPCQGSRQSRAAASSPLLGRGWGSGAGLAAQGGKKTKKREEAGTWSGFKSGEFSADRGGEGIVKLHMLPFPEAFSIAVANLPPPAGGHPWPDSPRPSGKCVLACTPFPSTLAQAPPLLFSLHLSHIPVVRVWTNDKAVFPAF